MGPMRQAPETRKQELEELSVLRPAHSKALAPYGVLAIVVVVSGALLAVASAVASSVAGGASIAAAPALPVEVRVVNATRLPEYWRLDLGLADQLVVDIGSTDRKYSAEVCVLDPDVNDYSSEGTPCRAMTSTNTKRQLRFVAPAAGNWIVVVYGCVGCTRFRPLGASYAAYEFSASVRRFTSVTLAPTTARVGRRATLRGTVKGAGAGPLQIVRRSSGRWVPLGTTQLRPDGSFVFKTTFYRRGVVQVGAVYAGDGRRRPSRETATVTVR